MIGVSHPALQPIVPDTETYDPTGRAQRAAGGGRGGGRFGGGQFGGGPFGGGSFGGGGMDEGMSLGSPEDGRGPGGYGGPGGSRGPGIPLDLETDEPAPELVTVTRYPFTLEFVWKKIPPDQRTPEPPAAADPDAPPADAGGDA